jgi:hypothetical protein
MKQQEIARRELLKTVLLATIIATRHSNQRVLYNLIHDSLKFHNLVMDPKQRDQHIEILT